MIPPIRRLRPSALPVDRCRTHYFGPSFDNTSGRSARVEPSYA